MDPFQAYDTAVALARSGQDLASVPWFRRALADAPDQYWEAHHDYATALYNAAFRVRRRHGLEVPETRSAWERAACMRTGLEEFAASESLCREPADLAALRDRRARVLHVWGLRWDALAELRRARLADPSDRAMAVDQYLELLHHPERGAPPPGGTASRHARRDPAIGKDPP